MTEERITWICSKCKARAEYKHLDHKVWKEKFLVSCEGELIKEIWVLKKTL